MKMRKSKFLHTAICFFALCGAMLTGCLTGCEKENGNNGSTVSETEISETTAVSESVSETEQTEAETETVTEASEAVKKEYDPVPASTLNYDKVRDRVIFDDGENTLTAGQYSDALESCEEFTHWLDVYHAFQITDMDENGIPEIMLYRYNAPHMSSRLYAVTAEGKAEAVKISGHGFCLDDGSDECYEMIGSSPEPYEKDRKTVWIGHWLGGGTGGGSSGEYILKYDGSTIDGEVIRETAYETGYLGDDENGEPKWYWNDYYYIWGEEVTEEEYGRREMEYFDSLLPSDALYAESYIKYYDKDSAFSGSVFGENLAYTLNRYLDMREGADKNPYDELAGKMIGDVPAQEYVDAVISCGEFEEGDLNFQLADLNGDGMPEVIAYSYGNYKNYAKFYSVSSDKKAAVIPVQKNKLNEQLDDYYDLPDTLVGKYVQPYERDGETVWVGSFVNRGTKYELNIDEVQGDVILKYDGRTVSQEVLREHDAITTRINYSVFHSDNYYRRGEETDEEEYERLYREFIWNMNPMPEVNVYSAMGCCNRDRSQKELLAAAALEYSEWQQAVERRVIYSSGTEKLTAEQYIRSLENCDEFTDIPLLYRIQLADVNNDGIPEALVISGEYAKNTIDIFFVSADGAVRKIPVEKEDAFKWVNPYEKDGKTVWIADTVDERESRGGKAVLRVSENSARLEKICSANRTDGEYVWQGQPLPYEDYQKLYDDYFEAMDPSAEIEIVSAYGYFTQTNIEKLSDVVEEYLQNLPYTYNEIKDTVIFRGGKNSLTAGQYIDALINCREFTEPYKMGIQLVDLNGDGIPEISAHVGVFPITSYFTVSAEGEAYMLYGENGEEELYAELPEPYVRDGKIVWLSDFYDGGSAAGGGGDSFLTYEDGVIKKEIIRCYDYSKDYNTFEYYYTYYWGSDGYWDDTKGEEISEEEYESRYRALLAELKPAETGKSLRRLYGGSTFQYYELRETLAEMLKECLGL